MDREVFGKYMENALRVVRYITNETEEEQQLRLKTDTVYHAFIYHLAHLYYVIENDDHLNRKYREMERLQEYWLKMHNAWSG